MTIPCKKNSFKSASRTLALSMSSRKGIRLDAVGEVIDLVDLQVPGEGGADAR